jgi:hypothetical protein
MSTNKTYVNDKLIARLSEASTLIHNLIEPTKEGTLVTTISDLKKLFDIIAAISDESVELIDAIELSRFKVINLKGV